MYQIVYEYTTGDTEGSHKSTSELGHVWVSLDMAKLALRRMKEHYAYCMAYEDWTRSYDKDAKPPVVPEWLRLAPNAIPSWRQDKTPRPDDYRFHFNVLDDNGGDVWIYAGSYVGCFESLHGASIEIVEPEESEESDMSFTV
jgi:hypothetical protein